MPRPVLSVDDYTTGILAGNRTILSRAITLIESTRPDHQELADEVVARCMPYTGKGLRIGITGPPGAGKSTLINALGARIASPDNRLAVLAIDPSSKQTKGSILGDKTRMTSISSNPYVFVRPSPNTGLTGGLARKTQETAILCEAAGYDILLIETVGAGQSEFDVYHLVDMVLLVLITGAGDDLQGIKRGIMEIADLIVIHKADGKNMDHARQFKRSLSQILPLLHSQRPDWHPQVSLVSSIEKTGIDEIWQSIQSYHTLQTKSGYLPTLRAQQRIVWLQKAIQQHLRDTFYHHPSIQATLPHIKQQVLTGTLAPHRAAKSLLDTFQI